MPLSSRWTMPGRRAPPTPESRRAAVRERARRRASPSDARAGVHDEPRRLVHHQHVGVLVDDGERDRLGRELDGLGRRDLDGDPLARPQPVAGLGVARRSPATRPAAISAWRRVRERSGARAWSQRSSRVPGRRRARRRSSGALGAAPDASPGSGRRRGRAAGHRPARSEPAARSDTPTVIAESATLNAGQW